MQRLMKTVTLKLTPCQLRELLSKRHGLEKKSFMQIRVSIGFVLFLASVMACQGQKGKSDSDEKSESADVRSNNLEYSSGTLATVDPSGQLVLPGFKWTGRASIGSARYEILPVE